MKTTAFLCLASTFLSSVIVVAGCAAPSEEEDVAQTESEYRGRPGWLPGPYEMPFRNHHVGACLYVQNFGTHDGAAATTWNCAGNGMNVPEFHWRWIHQTDHRHFAIANVKADKCLVPENRSRDDGAHLVLGPCKDPRTNDYDSAARWRTIGAKDAEGYPGTVWKNELTGLCATATGKIDYVVQKPCTYTGAQVWGNVYSNIY